MIELNLNCGLGSELQGVRKNADACLPGQRGVYKRMVRTTLCTFSWDEEADVEDVAHDGAGFKFQCQSRSPDSDHAPKLPNTLIPIRSWRNIEQLQHGRPGHLSTGHALQEVIEHVILS